MQIAFYTLVNQKTVEPVENFLLYQVYLKKKLQYFKNINSVHVAAAVSEF